MSRCFERLFPTGENAIFISKRQLPCRFVSNYYLIRSHCILAKVHYIHIGYCIIAYWLVLSCRPDLYSILWPVYMKFDKIFL